MLDCFADAFEEPENYSINRPSKKYQLELLEGDSFIGLVALNEELIVGALAAYQLKKFEQERSEIYIYDLAVSYQYRRQGIATNLIEALQPIAEQYNAWVIYVQADAGDKPPTNLYNKLGIEQRVLHFDIPVKHR